MQRSPLIFALDQSRQIGENIARGLQLELSPHEEREFPDGEHKIRALIEVFERRVYVVHSLYSDSRQSVNDKLCRLLFFIGALHDAGAVHITAVIPYLAYARKDKRTQAQDPITTRYVANLFSAVQADAVITLEVHNPAAEENAFRCRYFNIDGAQLFAAYFIDRLKGEAVTVLAPDTGAVKKVQGFQAALMKGGVEAELAFMGKVRSRGVVSSSPLVGSVRDRCVIIYDDLISSGTTIANAVEECREASAVYVGAIHGSFTRHAAQLARLKAVQEIVVSDSVRSDYIDVAEWGGRLKVLDSSGVFVDFIRRSYPDGFMSAPA